MKITIRLFTVLQKYLPPDARGRATVAVQDGATVQQALEQLGIPGDIALILLVNGRQKKAGDILQDGDELTVFPPIAGG